MNDNVNRPKHYADSCSLECIDVMTIAFGAEQVYHFCKCNAFKYMWRYKNKGGLEDLKKAEWYIKRAKQIHRDGLHEMEELLQKLIKDAEKYTYAVECNLESVSEEEIREAIKDMDKMMILPCSGIDGKDFSERPQVSKGLDE